MKRARRPDVFNREAIVESFVRQGLARSVAEPLTSDLKLIIPILIRELGRERIDDMLQRSTAELHLRPESFWTSLTPYIVRWAQDELTEYKTRKQDKEEEPA